MAGIRHILAALIVEGYKPRRPGVRRKRQPAKVRQKAKRYRTTHKRAMSRTRKKWYKKVKNNPTFKRKAKQARQRRTAGLSGIVRWEKIDPDQYWGFWNEDKVAECSLSKSPSGGLRWSADFLYGCKKPGRTYWGYYPSSPGFDTLEEAQEAAEICRYCGDTPCGALTEPTEEVTASTGFEWEMDIRYFDTENGFWYGQKVCKVESEQENVHRAEHLSVCKGSGGGTWSHVGVFKSADMAKKEAQTCPKCGDTPCEGFLEPTEEVTAALSGLIQWRETRPDNYVGFWSGKKVAQVSMGSSRQWSMEFLCGCKNMHPYWALYRGVGVDSLEEAQEMAEICRFCGDTPCSALAEPTEEVTAAIRVKWIHIPEDDDSSGQWDAFWNGIRVGSVFVDGDASGEWYRATARNECDPSQEKFIEFGKFSSLNAAKKEAIICQACGDNPCSALSEPTEEITAVNKHIKWEYHPVYHSIQVGEWHGSRVCQVQMENSHTFHAFHNVRCQGKDWGEMENVGGTFKNWKDAQDAAEVCPHCGDDPCSELPEPTDEISAAYNDTPGFLQDRFADRLSDPRNVTWKPGLGGLYVCETTRGTYSFNANGRSLFYIAKGHRGRPDLVARGISSIEEAKKAASSHHAQNTRFASIRTALLARMGKQ